MTLLLALAAVQAPSAWSYDRAAMLALTPLASDQDMTGA